MVGADLSHRELLERVSTEMASRGIQDVFMVDVDFHHTDPQSWPETLEYVPNDVVKHFLKGGNRSEYWVPGATESGGIQEVQGRIRPQRAWDDSHPELSGAARDVARAREVFELVGTSYVSLFPAWMLDF